MRALVFFLLAFGLSTANAEQMKILKVKGRKAVVKLPKGMDVSKGDMVELGGGGEDSGDMGGSANAGSWSRAHRIGGSFDFESLTRDTDPTASISNMSLSALYGWNWGTMEFGPMFQYTSVKIGDGDPTTTMGFGGFFDYNLSPNKVGNPMVWFVGADILMTSGDDGTDTSTGMDFDLQGGIKWFGLSEALGLRAQLGYTMESNTAGDADTITDSGVFLQAGFDVYF